MEYKWIENNSKKLIVLFHGTGGDMESLIPLATAIDSTADILSFQGDHIEGGMRRYFPFPQQGHMSIEVLKEVAQKFLETFHSLDLSQYERITALGYSNGANFILSILQLDPQFVDMALLAHPSNFNYQFEQASDEINILATTGEYDEISPIPTIIEMHKTVKEHFFPQFELQVFNSGHELSQEELIALKNYYHR